MLNVIATDSSSISIHTTFVGGNIFSICVMCHMRITVQSISRSKVITKRIPYIIQKNIKKGVKKFFLRLFIFNKIQSIYCTKAPLSSTLNPSGVVVFVSMAPSAPR